MTAMKGCSKNTIESSILTGTKYVQGIPQGKIV